MQPSEPAETKRPALGVFRVVVNADISLPATELAVAVARLVSDLYQSAIERGPDVRRQLGPWLDAGEPIVVTSATLTEIVAASGRAPTDRSWPYSPCRYVGRSDRHLSGWAVSDFEQDWAAFAWPPTAVLPACLSGLGVLPEPHGRPGATTEHSGAVATGGL